MHDESQSTVAAAERENRPDLSFRDLISISISFREN